MEMRKLLAGTAVATTLMLAGALPAAANVEIPLGGFAGPAQLNFNNFESFKTTAGAIASTPAKGDENFGIFTVFSITTTTGLKLPLYSAGSPIPVGGVPSVLVGVFNDINVTSVTGAGANVKTTNTGGVFNLYAVPAADYIGHPLDKGLAGYTTGGCSTVGGLCYNGITNAAGVQSVLTLTLVPGIDPADPTATLTASVDTTDNPPTGQAAFNGLFSGDPQFAPMASGKDSFCPNAAVSGPNACPGADGVGTGPGGDGFALASQDPITVSVVPEPASMALLGGGLMSLGVLGRRRRNKKGARS
jgi:hypothetical protein